MRNAKRLKGMASRIRISEPFPGEIARERKRLYPEYKKARCNNLKATLVRDKLSINGELVRG
jgi:hypothetical protein